MAERKLEDLNLTPDKLAAMEQARFTILTQRARDEQAAAIIAANNPPLKLERWYARIWRWVKECF